MIYLYVIKSDVNGNLYVGICKDLNNRLKDHNGGKNRYTRGLRPWKIVFQETFSDWASARVKESIIKVE